MARTSSFKVSIDEVALLDELSRGKNGLIVAKGIEEAIQDDIEKKQQQLVKNFLSHPVSIEISGGPNGSNSSGTLGGYGNLFSFLGFSSSDTPLQSIEAILSKKLQYRVKPAKAGRFQILIDIPKATEIFENSPMPWANGMSWAQAIEKGVSNLQFYLFNPSGLPNSASGTGIQSRNKVSGVNFRKTPYITKLLKDFQQDLKKL